MLMRAPDPELALAVGMTEQLPEFIIDTLLIDPPLMLLTDFVTLLIETFPIEKFPAVAVTIIELPETVALTIPVPPPA